MIETDWRAGKTSAAESSRRIVTLLLLHWHTSRSKDIFGWSDPLGPHLPAIRYTGFHGRRWRADGGLQCSGASHFGDCWGGGGRRC
ncbi:hypothetical protein ARMGADRAFT_605005 [Armillaria gallica]|uniref:Uncharacterized protein n=1 Tax=Armillaria gallica TaxID=47427 RepID=A0A2H3CTL8_ARMGA|nr:hypothetical protein ARMGADRAFT_605005 [Armillaria gallica]